MTDFLIIRLSSLGDIIHTLPAFAALRRAHPDAEIAWVVQGKGGEILELVSGIDRIITVDPKGWLPFTRGFRRDLKLIRKSASGRERIALDFQGLLKSGLAARLSRAPRRIGFSKPNLREPAASLFYTERIPAFPENIHVIHKNLKLLEALDIHETAYDFPIEIPDELRGRVREQLQALGWAPGVRLVVLNVGAAWSTKRWFAEGWTALAGRMTREDAFPLLLWGSAEERKLAEAVKAAAGTPLTPELGIPEVMALLDEASLVVSGDTFAMQAACALARPVVGLFGPTTPRRNGPFLPRDGVIFHELECSHCYRRSCPDLTCLHRITPDEVIRISLETLKHHA